MKGNSPIIFSGGVTVDKNSKVSIDALSLGDQYDIAFLRKHGETIKRVVAPEYSGVNSITLSRCPNIEEFIIAKNNSISFEDGVLYSKQSKGRSIEYITKKVKELHIAKDVTEISNWHGVDNITIDNDNSSFVVQDNMLFSRRMNSLYFVGSNAKEVVIPEGVMQIHSHAFKYCKDLKKIVFPASYEWREWNAAFDESLLCFDKRAKNVEIVINGNKAIFENEMVILHPNGILPEVVLYLGDTNLCHIPESTTSPYDLKGTFSNVMNFEVDNNNPLMASVDGVILDKNKTKLLYYPPGRETFTIPDCVTSIGQSAFPMFNHLNEVVIPEHVAVIDKLSFANCRGITKVTVLNPDTEIADDAFLGCVIQPGENKIEVIDEEAIKRSVEEDISSIKSKEKLAPKPKTSKSKRTKNNSRKEFKYNDSLSILLPKDFVVDQTTDEDGNQGIALRWGEYQDEESGDTLYKFNTTIGETITYHDGQYKSADEIIDAFIDDQSGENVSRSYIVHGDHPYAFLSVENPMEVDLGFLGSLIVKNYLVFFEIVAKDSVFFFLSIDVKTDENEDAQTDEEILYEKMVEIAEGVLIDGEPLDLKGLNADKLRKKIEPQFSNVEDPFDFGFDFEPEEPVEEVRFDDNNNRIVIVDNKWSFVLPRGVNLQFDSEHVDIMGNPSTAQYVIEGVHHNGRYFLDFELHRRFDDGMSHDVDVLGCRFDNDVSAGNAQQIILQDGDDLFVDIASKPVLFFSHMIMIRVRGENINPWDFVMAAGNTDEELAARWDEVKALYHELADSIQLIGAGTKTKKKNKKKTDKEVVITDPDFIIEKGVLRKYIGHDANVVIPEGIKEIAGSVFAGRSDLKTVVVPEGVKTIGPRCFENCVNLERAELPKSLEELGGYAFVDCHKLKEVYLSDKLKKIWDSAFSECFVLKDVKLPNKIKEIDAFSFKNCDAFTHIVIPEGVTSIGFNAFSDCDNLEYLFIPASVTEIMVNFGNQHAFAGSRKLTIYTPSGSFAEQFASEWKIPYENAEKGIVTADNTLVKTSKVSAAKAAKKPFFSKDGSWTYSFDQQDTETNLDVLEETDEVKMFVILTNDKKMGLGNRKPNDFFKAYGDYFAALKKKEMLTLRETVLTKMADEEYITKSREEFMKNSVEKRFIVATKSCFDVTELGDFSQKADEAIEKTIEWYEESEATEVRALMNAELDRIKNRIDKQIKAVDPEWADWGTAKQSLKVFVRQKNDPQVELEDDCKLFQVERRETLLDDPKIVVEVLLCMDEIHQFRVTDGMPLYWGVSYVDVWKAARKNEIVDKVNCMGDYQAKEAMSKIRKKYPDAALIKQRQNAAKRDIADAAATSSLLSELDTLCLYAIADYEKNCGQKLSTDGIKNNYKEENNCFKKLKKKQIEQAFREMEKTISEGKQETKEYEAGFRALSTDERFQYITKPVFKHYINNPNAQQREKYLIDALTFTAKWYDSCELIYVEKKLNKLLQEYGEEIDRFFDEKNEGYMKDYHSLKKNLVIGLEHHIYKNDQFAQIDDGEYRCSVRTKLDFSGIFSVYYNNVLPWYWGVSRADIWNNAFRNDVFVPWLSSLDETIIKNPAKARRIAEKYVKMASQDTYVPDNPYNRNKIYAEIEPYEVVVENVNSKYGELTTDTVKMYLDARDADVRSEIERKAREEKTNRIKTQAQGFEKDGTINSLYKALELYRGIENDVDVKHEIETCEERIRAAKEELEKQKYYSEGKRLEEEETVSSIKKAAEQYELAEDYKDAANRAMKCRNHAKSLEDESRQELIELQNTLSKLKAQHANLGGLFKKRQRLEVEENIRLCEQKIRDVKAILEG